MGRGEDGAELTLNAGGLSLLGHLLPPPLPRSLSSCCRPAPGAGAVASRRALAAALRSASSLLL